MQALSRHKWRDDFQSRRDGPLRAILVSLSAFAAAALRPRTPLAKAIMLVLLIKLIGVTAMRIYLTAASVEPTVDAATMARVIGVASPAPQP
jgi:hypothetical protein